jgi:glycosyltransferase involved in cell wall biosynthesis
MQHAPQSLAIVPLRIAVLSSISWSTPPAHYGPWELFASLLTEGLVARGHDVTLFATGNSTTKGALSWVAATGWSEDSSIEPKVAECLHISSVFERADEFDIIHNSFDFLPLTYSRLTSTPVVTTIHGFSSENVVEVYRRYNQNNSYVSISMANRHPDLHYAATILHGIDTALFRPADHQNDNLLYFGRIHPHKGTEAAIEVARRTDRPLVIAGIIQDQEYFDRRIAPHIDGRNITYVGPVGGSERLELLGSSFALLHLIAFDEPFGLSVVEALASGTPVIATNRGSMPEIITPHVTGLLVSNLDEAVAAVPVVGTYDRQAIRADTAIRFDSARMVDGYINLYRSVWASVPLGT